MKIWKFSESSAYPSYAQQNVWSKHKTTTYDDAPYEMKELYSRFDNSLVYRKVTSVPASQPCVYFLFLPNDTYKIGETTVGSLHNRLSSAQTYFFPDVVLNGIQLCESSSVAKSLEKTVLDYFLGVERPPGREVVTYSRDLELVECYINVSSIIKTKYIRRPHTLFAIGTPGRAVNTKNPPADTLNADSR